MKINFDVGQIMKELHSNIKDNHPFEVSCRKCNESLWRFTYNYLKEKWEAFCENCQDTILIDIKYKIKN